MMDQDYKNSPEGREVQRLYGDLLPLSRPASSRPRMDLVQRAKIFTPYDALRGFDEAIDAVSETTLEVSKIELSEERKQELSDQFASLRKGMPAAVAYFVSRSRSDLGFYTAVGGTILQVDSVNATLSIQEAVRTAIQDPDAVLPCLEAVLREIRQDCSGFAPSADDSSPSEKSVSSGPADAYDKCSSPADPSGSHRISKNLPTIIHFRDVLGIML